MKNSKLCKVCALCFLSVLILSTFGAKSAFAKWKSYSFFNYSGHIVKYLYITATGYDSWGKDLLGSSVLGSGDSVSLRYNDKYRYYDVKVVFSDGDDLIFRKSDFRNVWRKTLFHRSGTTYTLKSN